MHQEEPNAGLAVVSEETGPLPHFKCLDTMCYSLGNDLLGFLKQLGKIIIPIYPFSFCCRFKELSEGLHDWSGSKK